MTDTVIKIAYSRYDIFSFLMECVPYLISSSYSVTIFTRILGEE